MSVSTSPYLADAPLQATTDQHTWVKDVALVMLGTLAITLIAQVKFPIPGTVVPVTLGTFGVLLVGAALGPLRGSASVGLYILLAAVGAPVLTGWAATGVASATFGYVIGYLLAALALGFAAKRGADKHVAFTALAAIVATLLVYLVGVPWLASSTGMSLDAALQKGMYPFLLGDALKAAAAAVLLPAAWKLVGSKK